MLLFGTDLDQQHVAKALISFVSGCAFSAIVMNSFVFSYVSWRELGSLNAFIIERSATFLFILLCV